MPKKKIQIQQPKQGPAFLVPAALYAFLCVFFFLYGSKAFGPVVELLRIHGVPAAELAPWIGRAIVWALMVVLYGLMALGLLWRENESMVMKGAIVSLFFLPFCLNPFFGVIPLGGALAGGLVLGWTKRAWKLPLGA